MFEKKSKLDDDVATGCDCCLTGTISYPRSRRLNSSLGGADSCFFDLLSFSESLDKLEESEDECRRFFFLDFFLSELLFSFFGSSFWPHLSPEDLTLMPSFI
jgi:hypothetical protein